MDDRIRLDPDLEATAATLYLLAHDDHLGETVGRRATGRDIVEVLMAGPMPSDRRLPEDFPTDEDVRAFMECLANYAEPGRKTGWLIPREVRAALRAVAESRRIPKEEK